LLLGEIIEFLQSPSHATAGRLIEPTDTALRHSGSSVVEVGADPLSESLVIGKTFQQHPHDLGRGDASHSEVGSGSGTPVPQRAVLDRA